MSKQEFGKPKKRKPVEMVPKPDGRCEEDNPLIELNAPWVSGTANTFSMPYPCTSHSKDTARTFIEERTRLHAMFIQEEAKTKRLGLVISTVLVLGGGVILIFAPEGKQILANWIGAALFVAAGGAAGYKRLWFKSKNTSVEALKDD